MKRKLADSRDSNLVECNSDDLTKESYKNTINRCITNARDATGRSVLNLSILRKNTESMVFRHTLTQTFSGQSKNCSNYLIDEIGEVSTAPFEVNNERDNTKFMDNIFWHSDSALISQDEINSLMS